MKQEQLYFIKFANGKYLGMNNDGHNIIQDNVQYFVKEGIEVMTERSASLLASAKYEVFADTRIHKDKTNYRSIIPRLCGVTEYGIKKGWVVNVSFSTMSDYPIDNGDHFAIFQDKEMALRLLEKIKEAGEVNMKYWTINCNAKIHGWAGDLFTGEKVFIGR